MRAGEGNVLAKQVVVQAEPANFGVQVHVCVNSLCAFTDSILDQRIGLKLVPAYAAAIEFRFTSPFRLNEALTLAD